MNRSQPPAVLDHVSIHVRDFDRAVRWYGDLGFRVLQSWRVPALNDVRFAYLSLGGGQAQIEIIEVQPTATGSPTPPDFPTAYNRTGYGHLALRVDDPDATLKELSHRGVPTFLEAKTYPMVGAGTSRRVGFVLDPEGNVVEFLGAVLVGESYV